MSDPPRPTMSISYSPAVGSPGADFELVSGRGEDECRFPFARRLEIGRWTGEREGTEGVLLIHDATVSSHHCVVSVEGGICCVRDTSRNGTWVDGRRLVPNVKVRIRRGQVLSLGDGNEFVLEGQASGSGLLGKYPSARGGTAVNCEATEVTILVGDIRDYTRLVACFSARAVQAGLSRVFRQLEAEVGEYGGSVKEYEGDAIFSFWEERPGVSHTASACRAALALHDIAQHLATEPGIWDLPVPLQLDWALATGPVVVTSHGEYSPMGLSMIGASVPLAFRLEKLANEDTGPIVTCERTRELAGDAFEFRDLGHRPVKGLETPPRVFALLRERTTSGDGG